jgi:hypothetical protein
MGRACSTHEKMPACRILARTPEGKRSLGILRRNWHDYIKMVLRVIGWGGIDWIGLTQDTDRWRAL